MLVVIYEFLHAIICFGANLFGDIEQVCQLRLERSRLHFNGLIDQWR